MNIDLRNVPFFYLNGRPDRRQHVEAQLRGFIHERVDGAPSPLLGDRKDLRLLAPLGHARLIEHAVRRMGKTFEPFVLLEDDVAWRGAPPVDGPLVISAPDYADAVYLGISACGALADRHDYCHHLLRNRAPGFPHLQRIYNMLTAHAVLFLSFRHTMAYAQAMIESCATGEPCDALSCRLFAKHEVFALGEPLMYQKGELGGQEGPTNIAWPDGGYTDAWEGRTCHKVHPFSTGLEPLTRETTVAVVVLDQEDLDRLTQNIPARLVVFLLRGRHAGRFYTAVRAAVPDAVVLTMDADGWRVMLRDLIRANPHNTYNFALMCQVMELQIGAPGVWSARSSDGRMMAVGGDLDALLAFTDHGAPSIRSLIVRETNGGYVVQEDVPG